MVVTLTPRATEQVLKLANMTPGTQRLIIGGTGLISHTTIDALNPFVDSETRKYSAVRSAIRMIVCTTSGFFARDIGQKLGKHLVETGKIAVANGYSKAQFALAAGNYLAVTGAILSILLIDVPFINKILNYTMSKIFN
ncbi:MAG: hypothetical protein AB7V50_02405, partial [Vampirovibrionia bacterium]